MLFPIFIDFHHGLLGLAALFALGGILMPAVQHLILLGVGE